MASRNTGLSLPDEIRSTEEQLRIYEALVLALHQPVATLDLLLNAEDAEEARKRLSARFGLDVVQATAVMEIQFRRATRLDRANITQRRDELSEHLEYLRGLPQDP
jgi:DNA gyrase subunit A